MWIFTKFRSEIAQTFPFTMLMDIVSSVPLQKQSEKEISIKVKRFLGFKLCELYLGVQINRHFKSLGSDQF
jgi:hypothetical protein